jgi:hypothetical protein
MPADSAPDRRQAPKGDRITRQLRDVDGVVPLKGLAFGLEHLERVPAREHLERVPAREHDPAFAVPRQYVMAVAQIVGHDRTSSSPYV